MLEQELDIDNIDDNFSVTFNKQPDLEQTDESSGDRLLKLREISKHTRYTNLQNKPWIEKYRPTKLEQILSQNDIVKILKNTIQTGNLPHLLLYGPPGTGKTSTILSIAHELFGPKIFSDRVLELNASDERGINIVRNKIIMFAKSALCNPDPKYPSPAFKIIILDEADAMTGEAQSALRKTIETYSKITRFCFICNYVSNIIDPIHSRCVKFRFKPIDDINIFNNLTNISNKENIQIDQDALRTITTHSNGDMRNAIMILQNIKYLGTDKIIDRSVVLNQICILDDNILNEIDEYCIKNNGSVKKIIELVEKIKSYCYPVQQVLNQINDLIINHDNIDDLKKSQICLSIVRAEKRLMDGGSEYLQIINIFMNIKNIIFDYKVIHDRLVL
jgi:replication factor C subunit 2/4